MTSKNLFFKRLIQDFEQRIWLPVSCFIVTFLMMEMELISRLDAWKGRVDFVWRAERWLVNTFYIMDASPFIYITGIMAVICAISGFSYIHSAKKLDVYHSIPIKREQLFGQQYCYGVLYYLVPAVCHIFICLAIGGAMGVFSWEIFKTAMCFLITHIVIFLASYSTVLVAVCLTGNLIISVMGSGVLLIYGYLFVYLKELLMSQFFVTFFVYDNETQMGMWALSPIHLIYKMYWTSKQVEASEVFVAVYLQYWVKFLIMAIVYGMIALLLYKKRPTEVAGKSIAFPISEPIIKTMVVFPVTILSGYAFRSVVSSYDGRFGWFLFGCIFGFVIICPLMEIIFRRDVKAVLAHPLQLIFNGALMTCILLALYFDVFGYDSYLPDEEDVDSYAIAVSNLADVSENYNSAMYRVLDEMVITDHDSVRELLQYAVEYTRPALMRNGEDIPMDTYNNTLYVKYHLKNGRDVYRNYVVNLTDDIVLQWLEKLYDNPEYKIGAYPVLTKDEKDYLGVRLDFAYDSCELALNVEQREELVKTYCQELKAITLEEILSEDALAVMYFTVRDSEEPVETQSYTTVVTQEAVRVEPAVEYEENTYREGEYYIYPSFTETIALLKEYGIVFANELETEDIISVMVTDSTGEVNDNDGLWNKILHTIYTAQAGQQKEMQEILSHTFVSGMRGDFGYFKQKEENIDVDITYINDAGEERNVSCYFRKGELPEFVKEDLKQSEAVQ